MYHMASSVGLLMADNVVGHRTLVRGHEASGDPATYLLLTISGQKLRDLNL